MRRRVYKRQSDMKSFADESFISCLYCIPRSWTLFSNGQWVRVFENTDKGLKLIREFVRPLRADKREPLKFSEKIAVWLDESLWNNDFDDLILVAPARVLRELDAVFSVPVQARIIAQVKWSKPRKDRPLLDGNSPTNPMQKETYNEEPASKKSDDGQPCLY